MSYASVASHNIPFGEMPQPDQNLADGPLAGAADSGAAADEKMNVLPPGSDPDRPDIHPTPASHPAPVVINAPPVYEPSTSASAPKPTPAPAKGDVRIPDSGAGWKDEAEAAEKDLEKKGKKLGKKARAELDGAESRLGPYWEKTKDVVLRPGTLGGLMGVVNVGLLGTMGYFAYTRRDQPWDRRLVGGAVAGTLALFGAEGYLAESYLETPAGRQEAERAQKEGSKMYLQAKEVVLRPGVAGGLAGALNVAVIGAVGFISYRHWNQPWDRRVVSAVTVGLLGLSGLEGWAGKEYKDKESPKH